jgi:hypothetical protein
MRHIFVITSLIPLTLIAACSQDKAERAAEGSGVTQTRMDDIDQIEGTISDEMIDTSESIDEAPLAKSDPDASKDAAKDGTSKSAAPKSAPKKPAADDTTDTEAAADE